MEGGKEGERKEGKEEEGNKGGTNGRRKEGKEGGGKKLRGGKKEGWILRNRHELGM